MPESASQPELLASLPEEDWAAVLAAETPAALAALEFDWSFWGRPKQFAPEINPRRPDGNWTAWLILAGRGFGKTRTGAEWVRANVCGSTPLGRGRYRCLALIAETAADARDVLVGDGKPPSDPTAGSGLLQVHPKEFRPLYEPSKRRLTWPNGAIATLYNAVEPEQLRGPEHDAAWCDELAKWRYGQETWDMLQFGLRVGNDPRVVITTTPKPIALLKALIAEPATFVTRGSSYENADNLAPLFLAQLVKRYEGTRLGRQELNAEILDDVPGALWSRAAIEQARHPPTKPLPQLRRVVVAVDPAMTSGEDADETGIIVAGLGADGHGYVLDDLSGRFPPGGEGGWAARAIAAYRAHRADRIVAERNNGGDMVEATLRVIDPGVSFMAVWATRGKAIRAEPVAALYERGMVHHVGAFPALEDQMCAFTSDFDAAVAGYSPDRLDALVWALSHLIVNERTTPVVAPHIVTRPRVFPG